MNPSGWADRYKWPRICWHHCWGVGSSGTTVGNCGATVGSGATVGVEQLWGDCGASVGQASLPAISSACLPYLLPACQMSDFPACPGLGGEGCPHSPLGPVGAGVCEER